MSFGFKDVVKLIALYIVVFIFTQFIRENYAIYETIGLMIFVTIIYFIVGIIIKRKQIKEK